MDVKGSLEQLENAAKTTPKSKSLETLPLAQSIQSHARKFGLSKLLLARVINVVRSPSYLDDRSITTLVTALYPATRVDTRSIHFIVASIGQGVRKPSFPVQILLLRWIRSVFEVLEDKTALFHTYAVLFNSLEILSLRSELSNLLAVITQRKHVKPFRIRYLLQLSRKSSNDPALLRLLQVFKVYCPNIVIDQDGYKGLQDPTLEPGWHDNLVLIQESNSFSEQSTALKTSFTSPNSNRLDSHNLFNAKLLESPNEVEKLSILGRLQRLSLNSHSLAALEDQTLQQQMTILPTEHNRLRIDHWLSSILEDFRSRAISGDEQARIQEAFRSVLSYTLHTKHLPNSVSMILRDFFMSWSYSQGQNMIVKLLSYKQFNSFAKMRDEVLELLQHSFQENSENGDCALLEMYTAVFRTWAARILSIPDSTASDPLGEFVSMIYDLVLKMLASGPSVDAQVAILTSLETLTFVMSKAPRNFAIRILYPPPKIVYLTLFMSSGISILSSLTASLATYKTCFETTMIQRTSNTSPEYPRQYVNEFNGFLMDICNMLWRGRALNTSDTNALGCLLPAPVNQALRAYAESLTPAQSIPHLFSLSFHNTSVALSTAAFREMEERYIESEADGEVATQDVCVRNAGPVMQKSLAILAHEGGVKVGWAEYRLEVLRYLDERGALGIGQLMHCTMKLLMNGRTTGHSQTMSSSHGPTVH